jgi:hypothetical protein
MSKFRVTRRALLGGAGAFLAAGPVLAQPARPLSSLAEGEAQSWSPLAFPEMIVNAWLQDDLPLGRVASHQARGIRGQAATQGDPERQPVKLEDGLGVEFAADRPISLTIPTEWDAVRLCRWSLIIFRVGPSDADTEPMTLLNINEGKYAGERVPWIRYRSDTRSVSVVYGGAQYGRPASIVVDSPGVVADGQTWNVHLQYRRNGRVFSRLNGEAEVVDTATGSLVYGDPSADQGGRIGEAGDRQPSWAYDSIIVGQSELSEALAEKMQAWAMWRVGRQADLPASSPYRVAPPQVDAEDQRTRYAFNPEEYAAWTAAVADKEAKFVNRGKPVPPEGDVVTVFRDDFRADSVYRHDSGPTSEYIWFGQGWNTSVGVSAFMLRPDQKPDLYIHDPIGKTLTLSLEHADGWKSPAIYSVNASGQGRSWQKGIFEVRCKFPSYEQVPGGFIPAFWSYSLEPLFWRTGERIEIDFIEPHGKNDMWMNGGNTHVHAGQIPGLFGHLAEDARAVKMWGGEMNRDTVGIDFHYWDGEFHTYTFRVDDDLTYLSIDGRELFRVPTSRELKQRIYLILNFSLRVKDGEPDQTMRHDMIIDYVEVRQKRSDVEAFAAPFTARPRITGEATVGRTLTVEPNIEGIRDISYDWYRDGYPILGRNGASRTVRPGDAGGSLRCLVRAVGYKDHVEAWTDAIDIPA